jgi:hypothetical protein
MGKPLKKLVTSLCTALLLPSSMFAQSGSVGQKVTYQPANTYQSTNATGIDASVQTGTDAGAQIGALVGGISDH